MTKPNKREDIEHETMPNDFKMPTRFQIKDRVLVKGRRGEVVGIFLRASGHFGDVEPAVRVFYWIRFSNGSHREVFSTDVAPYEVPVETVVGAVQQLIEAADEQQQQVPRSF